MPCVHTKLDYNINDINQTKMFDKDHGLDLDQDMQWTISINKQGVSPPMICSFNENIGCQEILFIGNIGNFGQKE